MAGNMTPQELISLVSTISGPPRPQVDTSDLTAENIAVALGLKVDEAIDDPGEMRKIEAVNDIIERMSTLPEEQQDAVYSKLAAIYLPALVDKFMNLPPLPRAYLAMEEGRLHSIIWGVKNPYSDMLIQLQHIPYFVKYLRSSLEIAEPGKRLTETIASRLADLAPRLESPQMLQSRSPGDREAFKNVVGDICQLLSTLLVIYSRSKDRVGLVSDDTKTRLLPFLRTWSQRYPRHLMGSTTARTLCLLEERPGFLNLVQPMRKKYKGLGECGLPSCDVKTNLKACGRCVTVRYCSPAHQKAHWSLQGEPHKDFCHKTEY